MNSKQQYTFHFPTQHHPPSKYHHNKQEQLMNHFNSLKNSTLTQHKTSTVTTAPDYSRIIHEYSQKESRIDEIVGTFENPRIYDLLAQTLKFTTTNAHLSLNNKIIPSLIHINRFFNTKQPLAEKIQDLSFLNIENLSQYLVCSVMPSPALQQITIKSSPERVKSQFISIPKDHLPAVAPIQTKIDLVLVQLEREKKRKNDKSYQSAMNIILTELIDYLTQEDQRYLGLSLFEKAKEIAKNINQYKRKSIDGYLLLPFIELFFEQLKSLHLYQLQRLRQMKKSKPKRKQTCSQLQKKSIKSQKSQGGKFSEPRGSKKKILGQQQWIGKLD